MVLFLALPSLKNVMLFMQYEHGRTALDKVRGEENELLGIWEGVFDTYQCGMDERHLLQFTFTSDTTGRLVYRHLYERIDGHGADIYDWRSFLPFDQKRASTYVANVIVEDENLIIIPNEAFFSPETLIATYRIEDRHMHFAYVTHRNAIPEEWGISFSPRPHFVDLLELW